MFRKCKYKSLLGISLIIGYLFYTKSIFPLMKEKIKMSTNKMFGSTQTNGFIRVKEMLQEYP